MPSITFTCARSDHIHWSTLSKSDRSERFIIIRIDSIAIVPIAISPSTNIYANRFLGLAFHQLICSVACSRGGVSEYWVLIPLTFLIHLLMAVPVLQNHVFTAIPVDFFSILSCTSPVITVPVFSLSAVPASSCSSTVPVVFYNHVMLIVPVGYACTKHSSTHNLASFS